MKNGGSVSPPLVRPKLKALNLPKYANKPGDIANLSVESADSFL